MKTSHIFLTCLVVALSSCNVKLDGKTDAVAVDPTPQTAPATVLNGTWKTGCVAQHSFFSKSVVTIDSNNYQNTTGVYSDAACQVPVFAEQKSAGTFQLRQRTDGIYEIDMYSDLGNGASQIFYDIIQYGGDRFFMGDTTNVNGSDRPTKIDQTKPFIKQ